MVLRNRFSLHNPIPNLKDVLRVHFSKGTVEGVKHFSAPSSLRYDTKLLGDASTYLKTMWCSLHKALITPSNDVNVFDTMMWLSTMAYAESADMNVVQALAALYADPEYARIDVPAAPTFNLAAGDTWRSDEIQSIVQRQLLPFCVSTESRLPRQGHETEQQHLSRIRSLFQNRQDTATKSFMVALQQQWPVRRLSTPTSAAISKSLDVSAAMEEILVKCKDWYDNRELWQYLDRVSRLCAHHAVSLINQPRYILPMPIKKEALPYRLRKFTLDEIFAAEPPCISPECK